MQIYGNYCTLQRMKESSSRWDWLSAVLLFFAILFSAWRVQSTDWTDNLNYVRNLALLGAILGMALGYSYFEKRGVSWLVVGYTLVIFPMQLLTAMDRGLPLASRLFALSGRLLVDLTELFAGRPVNDPLFFALLLCIPYWFLSLVAGYQLIRHANVLAAIMPIGVLTLIVHVNNQYGTDRSWVLGAYMLVCLLLVGRHNYLRERKGWIQQRVQIPEESALDFNNAAMISAVTLVIAAWMLPSILTFSARYRDTWGDMTKQWREVSERFSDMFAAAKYATSSSDFYRDQLSLGTQALQSETVVFMVYAPVSAQQLPRLYWRGRIYDRFDGSRWSTTTTKLRAFKPGDGSFDIPYMQRRENLNFTFSVYLKDQTTLYVASEPLWISRQASIVKANILAEGEAITTIDEDTEIVALVAYPPLEMGETYSVNAMVANPSIAELREADEAYPEWVTDRYLQLPGNFSGRIRSLAVEITSAQDTPYDKALAITNYLRGHITYSPSIVFPARSVDPLEYFLFDTKRGFCNYYASVEVLMMRAAGIPARLAVGFAQGELDAQSSYYTVRERDAHAWPEAYFPGYGWIEFEPTSNQPLLDRPAEKEQAPAQDNVAIPQQPRLSPLEEDDTQTPQQENQIATSVILLQWLQNIAPIGAGFIVLLFAFLLKRRYAPNMSAPMILKAAVERGGWETPFWLERWAQWTMLTPFERAFFGINFSLRAMGKPQPIYATPLERATVLRKALPSASDSIDTLAQEHQSAMFTDRGGNLPRARRASLVILYQTVRARVRFAILGYN